MIKRHIIRFFILILSIYASVCVVSNADEKRSVTDTGPDIANGQKHYRLCASCHLANGWGKPDGSFPVIAGQHPDVMLKQMEDIRSRNRENPTMYPFSDARTLGSEQDLRDVIAYITTLQPTPTPGTGDGSQLNQGKQIYQQYCQQCHGKKAEGNNQQLYPRLRGQHYAYLLRQLKGIKDGYRKNADPAMVSTIQNLNNGDLDAVADYLSRL